MKHKKFSLLIKLISIAVLSTILLLQNGIFTYAQPLGDADGAAQTFTLKDFGVSSDDTYQGVMVSRDYGISLPLLWNYSHNIKLNLKFVHSPSLNAKSTMTVDWNDVRLGNVQLTSENANNGQFLLEIPASNIHKGYNTLHIEFYMGISDNFCDDYDNPAVWATVQNATTMEINPDLITPKPDMGSFPLPFIDSGPLVNNHIYFVIPENPGAGEINTLAVISAKLGQLSQWNSLSGETIYYNDAKQKLPKGNLIVIGTLNAIKDFNPNLVPSLDQKGAGILAEFVSPFDPNGLALTITGEGQDEVEKAGRALTNSILYPRLAGNSVSILDDATTSSGTRPTQSSLTFKQLGYPDNAVFGTREQKINYNITLPALWQSKTEAVLNLHFLHSAITTEKHSSLTVSVNNLPVGSITLTADNANNGHASFQLPLSFFHTGINDLTIQANMQGFDNRNDISQYCTNTHLSQAWLTSINDSQILFPSSPNESTTEIANFPFTFMGVSDLSQLAFVLPNAPTISDLQALSGLSLSFGKVAQGEPLLLHVINSDQAASQESTYPYQVLIGLPLQNPSILAAGSLLPLPFDSATGNAMPMPILDTIDAGKISTGYIQAYLTPNQIPHLVVTGNNYQGLLLAVSQLSVNANVVKLKGDLAITTGADRVMSIWGKQATAPSENKNPAVAKNELTLSNWFLPDETLYTAAGVLVLAVLVLLIRLIVILLQKRTNR